MGKVEERRAQIISNLSTTPIATITELAELLGVSLETIRKDLEVLSKQGAVVRAHGSTALANHVATINAYDLRANISSAEKKRIAKAACKLIKAGDSIILESGTTTQELCKVLIREKELIKTLVIITNSFTIAQMLDGGSACKRLFFLGGWANSIEHSTKGSYTAKQLEAFHVEKAFIGGASLSDSLILTGYYEDDSMFQTQALKCAKTKVLLIDSSKHHKSSLINIVPLSDLDYIVTDINFTIEEQNIITRTGAKIIDVN